MKDIDVAKRRIVVAALASAMPSIVVAALALATSAMHIYKTGAFRRIVVAALALATSAMHNVCWQASQSYLASNTRSQVFTVETPGTPDFETGKLTRPHEAVKC